MFTFNDTYEIKFKVKQYITFCKTVAHNSWFNLKKYKYKLLVYIVPFSMEVMRRAAEVEGHHRPLSPVLFQAPAPRKLRDIL